MSCTDYQQMMHSIVGDLLVYKTSLCSYASDHKNIKLSIHSCSELRHIHCVPGCYLL